MDKKILINVSEDSVLTTSEEVLVEVRGRPPSGGDHVILASGSQLHQQQQLHFKSEDDDFVVPNMGSLGYLASGVTSTHEQDSHPDIDLDEFMDIVTIKCRSCNFFCSTKSQLVEHVRTSHRSLPDDEHIKNYNVSEEQRQLISSLLALANEGPPGSQGFDQALSSRTEHLKQETSSTTSDTSNSVYLCGECSLAFNSITKCNEHMLQIHQRSKIVLSPGKIPPEKTTTLYIDNSTKSRYLSTQLKRKICQKHQTPPKILPKTENVQIETSTSLAKRRRKPVSKFEDFVLDNSTKKLLLVSDLRKSGSQDETRCLVKGCSYLFSKDKLSVHMSCHLSRTDGHMSSHLDRTDEQEEDSAKSKLIFCCPECRERFGHWRNCAMHLWRSHQIDVDLLTCPVCNTYKTIIPARLEIHMLTHSEDRPFSCSVCKSRFKQLAQLKNHSVIHMDKEKDVVPLWYTKKLCNLCGKYFADSKCLKKHVQTVHSKLKPYICQVCNHQSARKAMLEMHMRQHTGEKPYSCDVCEYRTGDHNSLRRHKMRHSGRKPYKCPFCAYACIQSEAYKKHVQSQHPAETASDASVYICSQCPYKAINLDTYIGHQRSHIEQMASQEVDHEAEANESLDSNTESHSNLDESNSSVGPEESDHSKAAHKNSMFNAPVSLGKRGSKLRSSKKNFGQNKSRFKSRRIETPHPMTEEEDSLHGTTDLGGTTIPAEGTP